MDCTLVPYLDVVSSASVRSMDNIEVVTAAESNNHFRGDPAYHLDWPRDCHFESSTRSHEYNFEVFLVR